jgi:hypothetical protein
MPAAKQFRRIQTTDQALNLIQDQLQDLFKQILANPWTYGRPLYQVKLVAGTNLVQHGLGRAYVDCYIAIPTAVYGGAFGSDSPFGAPTGVPFGLGGAPVDTPSLGVVSLSNVQPDRTQYVAITATAGVTVGLFVF